MADPFRAPNALVRTVVGWRAGRIADPVSRLRFLRHSVGDRRVWDPSAPRPQHWIRRHRVRVSIAILGLLAVPAGHLAGRVESWASRDPVVVASAHVVPPAPESRVWLAERTDGMETWSNGLRIERKFETTGLPRRFSAYERGTEDPSKREILTAPVGIVYHATESHQADFHEENAKKLHFIGESLLRYVQREQSYHYVVDRFGRVWRVVREEDGANHAGKSAWSDEKRTYVLLNRGFLGVAVEAQTQPEGERSVANEAQIHALRVLTEMLRAKYDIPAENCVTHAQVSVSPLTRGIAYHRDWAANFPYREVGLPDNYALPPASLWLLGFTYDPSLVKVTGPRFWQGLLLAEEQLRQTATAHGVSASAWREQLFERWRRISAQEKEFAENKETEE